nr:EOG090X09BG [Macrothrix elegans]
MSAIASIRVLRHLKQYSLFRSISNATTVHNKPKEENNFEDDFRSLDLGVSSDTQRGGRRRNGPTRSKAPILPPRSMKMPVDQDWPSVWPVAKTFHPASVPLPLHQGWVEVGSTPPGKYANAELMKIPNFLHLTPPAIQRHCRALKKFCTEWPKELNTEEQIEKHFPIEITTTDFVHSSPTIRDARARVVTMQVKLSSLPLNEHAKDKLLRLVKERYDLETDILTIVADRCPLRRQNQDYAEYLLTVLVSESWKTEPWENEKSNLDMEKYVWEGSPSQRNVMELLEKRTEKVSQEVVDQYAQAVTRLHNEGENEETVEAYASSVKKLLGFPQQ